MATIGLDKLFYSKITEGENGDETDKIERLQRGDLRRDRGADVRAHDDRRRLIQGHEPDVDETHDHDRGRRRALNDRRHARAYSDARKAAFGSFVEPAAQFVRRETLDVVRQDLESEQKRTQPRQKFDE